jgi:hypothetical protein
MFLFLRGRIDTADQFSEHAILIEFLFLRGRIGTDCAEPVVAAVY